MLDPAIRDRVKGLLAAVRESPDELPIEQIAALTESGARVTIDREGPEPVVFVTPGPDARFQALSPREKEVAVLVAAGFTNAQIADALFIAVGTVKDHVHAVLRKTELASRAEVAAAWYGHL